ncbi:IS30 family transposase [Pseudomonas aeruginosa]|jgi:transposase, IS30 family|nr:IS30 family transposase [Pseudomonas aeruginosa]ELM3781558.1 IS30 family transposase [Pseudomonas aeruginosa]ELM3845676.1 IS30 family transposase [Pseudomonas aeruginosa]ELM3846302.1 IS30 family transposase [Pseudomonas aeruginosa]ELP2775952.1 IS30 family transposase [Pseudomonas aeruginosa]
MYKHLSREERYQIYSLRLAKQTISEIARLLGRHRSTISRELGRGRGLRGYRAEQACSKASERAKKSRNARRVDAKVWADVSFYLGLQWSPEQIASKLEVSHESVYLHVYANKAAGGQLHKNLRSQKPRRKRHLSGRDRRGQIPNRRPISERPEHIEQRRQVGHWEGDTVIGAAHKQAIVTLVERKSGFAVLAKVSNKTTDLVRRAIEIKLKPLCSRVKTLTVDNGKEFADHQAVDQALGIQTFFADPYCSWQRGSNENFNGLLRQYIPKKRRMETVSEEELTMIENRLNHRPRKRLGFKTPHEVFYASLNRVAPRT